MTAHPREQLTAYADGELDLSSASEIERHLAICTECARELAIVRSLKGAVKEMQSMQREKDLWSGIHRRLTKPIGWILILAGTAVWMALAAIQFFRQELTIEWLAASALLTGAALLLVGIGHEQYRQWKNERYKDVER
jgi:anti-sigma factor RsiW